MFSKDFTTSWLVSLSQNKIFVHCNCKKSLFFSEKDVFRAEQHLNRWARKISQPCCQWQGEKTLSRMDRTTRSALLWHKITVPAPLAPSNKRFSLPKGETKILGVRLTCVLLESAASRRIRGASKIQHYITHKNSACARIFAEQLFRARGLPQGEIPEAASIFFLSHRKKFGAHAAGTERAECRWGLKLKTRSKGVRARERLALPRQTPTRKRRMAKPAKEADAALCTGFTRQHRPPLPADWLAAAARGLLCCELRARVYKFNMWYCVYVRWRGCRKQKGKLDVKRCCCVHFLFHCARTLL